MTKGRKGERAYFGSVGPVVQLDRTSASEAESQRFESARDYRWCYVGIYGDA